MTASAETLRGEVDALGPWFHNLDLQGRAHGA
jgi:hypothetical protein